jgi:hypothetical protein
MVVYASWFSAGIPQTGRFAWATGLRAFVGERI